MLSMRLSFNLRCLASQFLGRNAVMQPSCRDLSSKNIGTEEKEVNVFSIEDEDEEEKKLREAAIEQSRNKSDLQPHHYNKQHDRPPYEEPLWEYHDSLKYRRRLYGKYGASSNVDPSILWPSKIELDLMKEYEEAAQPFTVQTLIEKSEAKKALLRKKIKEQEEEILNKVDNIKFELIEFHKRVATQKKKALELMEHKNKLIQQVRKHIGYDIDTRDAKFKELFEKLQKEERKKLKMEKKIRMEEKKKEMSNSSLSSGDDQISKELEN